MVAYLDALKSDRFKKLVAGANLSATEDTAAGTVTLTPSTSPALVGANFSGLTASRLVSTDGSKNLVSTDPATFQAVSTKDAAGGYAGLNASSRTTKGVDTTDDLIIDLATKGLVLKDTQATPHYWRLTITTLGALVTTDLGTVKP